MNKLKLITSALAMCGLVGTAYAGDPNILPLNPPIIPLKMMCTLTLKQGSNYWTAPANSSFVLRINDDKGKQIKVLCTNPVNNGNASCDATGYSTTFDCTNMAYFWIEGKEVSTAANKLVGAACGNGNNICDPGYQWKYWSYGLKSTGIDRTNFILGVARYGGNKEMCVTYPPADSKSTCS